MRTIAEHIEAVLALARPRTQRMMLMDAAGHHLAAPTTARIAVPPFDNSAMDGFAVHAADLAGGAANGTAGGTAGGGPWTLPVAGDIPAGGQPVPCPPGHAVRIMTGAPVPQGSGTGGDEDGIVVVPVEQTNIPRGPVPLPEAVTINEFDPARDHIRRAGHNARPGEVVAEAGTLIDAGTLAALVSTGVTEVEVYAKPKVTVITTGDELVDWPQPIAGAQIPNSNLPMLAQLAKESGAGEVAALHVGDAAQDFAAVLEEAACTSDIVVTSGGVSAGAFDVVRAATEDLPGMWFGSVSQRPGGPQGLGTINGTPLICLPGNPVAAFVSAHLYVAPLIRAAAGQQTGLRPSDRPRVTVNAGSHAGEDFPRPRKDVTLVVPVRLDFSGPEPRAIVFSGEAPGSHMVASLSEMHGLALVPRDAGDLIDVLLT